MPGVDGERGRVMERRSGELVFNGEKFRRLIMGRVPQ